MADYRCDDPLDAARRQRAVEEASIRQSIRNLMTFPCVRILAEKGRLRLHGAWFEISSGGLWLMEPKTGDFHQAQT
jgi:carbonic anhydrase